MEYSGAGGKLIHEKNPKQKISWHCPFNMVLLHNGGSCNDRTIMRSITLLCISKQSTCKTVLFLIVA